MISAQSEYTIWKIVTLSTTKYFIFPTLSNVAYGQVLVILVHPSEVIVPFLMHDT